MIKLRVDKDYSDVELKKDMKVGDVIEVSLERGKYLLEKKREKPRVFGFTILRIDKIE